MSRHEDFNDLPVILLSDGAIDPEQPNIVCRLNKARRASGQLHLEDGLASILFSAMDRRLGHANDNFAV